MADTRRPRWRALLVVGTLAIGLTVDRAGGAPIPSVSEELRGGPPAARAQSASLPRRDDGPGAPGRVRVRRVPGDLLRQGGWHVLDDALRLSADRPDAAGRVGDRWAGSGGDAVLARPVRWRRTASTMGGE